ncbi:MAG: tyrosine-type recombinase/integrase [Pyrinomonadaceae bacterium]
MNESQSQRLKLMAERFSEWLEAINYSPKTRVNYTRDVKIFLDWLAENTSVSSLAEVSPAHLQQYQIALYNFERRDDSRGGTPCPPAATKEKAQAQEAKRLSVGTQANRLAAVRKFFSWLLSEQQIAYNPASTLQLPKQPQRLPRGVLTKSEARRLIETTPTKKQRDIRDRALLETLYATGIRRAELIALTIYDADLQTATLRIEHGKGNTTRIVPLTQSAIAALKLYLEEARAVFAREAGQVRLFVSTRSGGPLDDDDIVRIVAKAATRAGIKKHVTPHTLRHTCATHLLKGRADIRQIQKLLGHRRLSSTEVYTRVELTDLHEVIARCHPREKQK